jgi:DNA end-binding protein Ku
MASAVWSGHLHFGLVVMPVRLLVAARTKTTRFRRLHRKPVQETSSLLSFPSLSKDPEDRDSDTTEEVGKTQFASEEMNDRHRAEPQYFPVRQVLQSEITGEEIRPDEMVKGYEVAPGEYAAIDLQEIKAAEIETSDTIDLFHFVKEKEVDPIYFERSYYVIPDTGAEKGYALLLEAMRKDECLGIARIGMHRREHMLILRPSKDCLVAYTMFYANEVRPAPPLELATNFSNKELAMATALIKGYEGNFDPQQFKDLYQERIGKIIEARVENRIEMHPEPTDSTREAPDLLEQIRLSLAQIESKKKPDANPSKKPARKTPTLLKKKPQRA